MITTHTGTGYSGLSKYEFEVLKEGTIHTLNVKRDGQEIESIWCNDMTQVRKNITKHVGKNYKLNKKKKGEQ